MDEVRNSGIPTPFTQAEALEASSQSVVETVAKSRFAELSASYGWALDLLALVIGGVASYRQFTASQPAEATKPASSGPDKMEILNRIFTKDDDLNLEKTSLWDAIQVLGPVWPEPVANLFTQYFEKMDEGKAAIANNFSNLVLLDEAQDWINLKLQTPYQLLNVEDKHAEDNPDLKKAIIKTLSDATIIKIVNKGNSHEGHEKRNELERLLKTAKQTLDSDKTSSDGALSNEPSEPTSLSWGKAALPLILAVGAIVLRRALPSLIGRVSR